MKRNNDFNPVMNPIARAFNFTPTEIDRYHYVVHLTHSGKERVLQYSLAKPADFIRETLYYGNKGFFYGERGNESIHDKPSKILSSIIRFVFRQEMEKETIEVKFHTANHFHTIIYRGDPPIYVKNDF